MAIKDQLKNDRVVLNIIMLVLRTMEAKGNTSPITCDVPRKLSADEKSRLRAAILRVTKLHDKVQAEIDTRETVVTVREFCDCPTHLACLRESGIVTLSQLYEADPDKLLHILEEAEKKSGGVVHYELYCGIKFHMEERERRTADAPSPQKEGQ